jgi:hypothetical protein
MDSSNSRLVLVILHLYFNPKKWDLQYYHVIFQKMENVQSTLVKMGKLCPPLPFLTLEFWLVFQAVLPAPEIH